VRKLTHTYLMKVDSIFSDNDAITNPKKRWIPFAASVLLYVACSYFTGRLAALQGNRSSPDGAYQKAEVIRLLNERFRNLNKGSFKSNPNHNPKHF
jgi:hypothetical protein